ncbi:MAG: hypothetical protein WC845_02280 [Candidatus Staskawiczbacteria bacterium]|jgi:hypothetical protein
MKQSNNTYIIVIVSIVVLFGIGCLVGFSFEKSRTSASIEKLQTLSSVLNSLSSSQIIVSTIAYGRVKSISDSTIVLNRGEEDLSVAMIPDAQVYLLSNNGGDLGSQKQSQLTDIKIGDDLNISVKILPDGQIQGLSAVIFPPIVAQ